MVGIEGEGRHIDPTAQQHTPTEQLKPQQEGGNGDPGLPLTTQERAKPPPDSVLSRAVERTRDLYERNEWVFLPLGEAEKGSSGIPTLQGEQEPHGGGINKPELYSPKELPLPFAPNPPRPDQQIADLDPEMEMLLRSYAESVAEGDPEYEKSLRERYKNDPSFRKTFDRFRRGGGGAGTLASSSPDFSRLLKKQEDQE